MLLPTADKSPPPDPTSAGSREKDGAPLTSAQIKDLYSRKERAMRARPSFARGTGQAHAKLVRGFACDVDHGDRTMRVDMPREDGGGSTGPSPGQLMRASLSACLAMGYLSWSARLDIFVADVEVDITCEYDARGQMGLDPLAPVGWKRIVFEVKVTSGAPADDVRRLVEHANRLSPMLTNLASSIEQVHHLTIVRSEEV